MELACTALINALLAWEKIQLAHHARVEKFFMMEPAMINVLTSCLAAFAPSTALKGSIKSSPTNASNVTQLVFLVMSSPRIAQSAQVGSATMVFVFKPAPIIHWL